jgi:hypothetical protein
MERQDADDRKDLSEKAGLCLLIKKECSQIYGDILFFVQNRQKTGWKFLYYYRK